MAKDEMLPSEVAVWNAAYAATTLEQLRGFGVQSLRKDGVDWPVKVANAAVLALREYRKAHGDDVGVLIASERAV